MKALRAILCAAMLGSACSGCEKEEKDELQYTEPVEKELHEVRRGEEIQGKRPVQNWLNYRIPKAEHYNSLKSFQLFEGDSLYFRFAFDSSAVYQTLDPANQADWNKLMGFSDCGTLHHSNSIRLVWRYAPQKAQIEIGEYRYSGGERFFTSIGATAIGDTNTAAIIAGENNYHIMLNDMQVQRSRKCSTRMSSYWLYPYFGGDETAPHDISIHILHLE